MRVLVDTSVWSLVLRRDHPDMALTAAMTALVESRRIVMIGPVRQEILSGLRNQSQFNNLKKTLAAFPDLLLRTPHYEEAARFCNMCRKKGVQGSHIDFLICAASSLEKIPVFTTDRDFDSYKKHLNIDLFDASTIA